MSRKKYIRTMLFRLLASIAVMVVVFAGFAPPAAASSHPVASGSFDFVVVSDTVRTVGQNLIIIEHAQVIYSGGLAGTADDYETIIVRPDGTFAGFGSEDCASCTFGNRTGSYSAVIEFQGSGIPFRGTLHFVNGAGGLTGLQGGGNFQGDDAGHQTYSSTYWFEPEQ
jgi:hypothetical protein